MHNLSNDYFQEEIPSLNGNGGFELDPEFEFQDGFDEDYDEEFELSAEFETEDIQFELYEIELAEELLLIDNEAEFGNWVKKVAKRTAGGAGNLLSSPTMQKATSALGTIAKKTLPVLGGVAGKALGGAVGSKIGGNKGRIGGSMAGLQAGNYLGAKAGQAIADNAPRFVKFTADTLKNLSKEINAGNIPEIKPAIIQAATKHYPMVLQVKNPRQAQQLASNILSRRSQLQNEDNDIDQETGFSESIEMELAGDLLNIHTDDELDMFIGGLMKKAAKGVSNFARSSTGKAVGGMLKNVARKALPIAGGVVGNFIAPGVGGIIGGKLGSLASNMFELELEGLSPEDQEFELARAYVRFAGNAVKNAAKMSPNMGTPAASAAITHAAKNFAPGLLNKKELNSNSQSNGNNRGTWYRKNGNIILQGV